MAQHAGAPAGRDDLDSFFETYFQQNPTHTLEQGIAAFDAQKTDDDSFLERAADTVIPPALRVGGAIAGGVVGSAGGPAGTIAGHALGSGLGETAAEGYEVWRGKRTKLNPGQIAVQTALGAVPVGGRAASIARTVGRRAVQGGALGSASTALTNTAEGREVTAEDLLKGAGLGTVLGAAGGRVEAALAPRASRAAVSLPRLEGLQRSRELLSRRSPILELMEKVTGAPRAANRALVDQFADVRDFVAKGEKAGGLRLLPSHDPRNIVDLVYGGTSGRTENAFRDFRAVLGEAEEAGLDGPLRQYLDLKGLSRGADTLTQHAAEAFAKGDEEGMNAILGRLAAGEALPEGYTPALLSDDLRSFESQLGPRFADVERLGHKVFQLNRQALDTVHEAGIISDALYSKLTARGAEYVPLNRILDGVLDAQTKARASNLSLRQQKVLFNLEGSKRATQDPIEASMTRAQEAIREAGRNEAAKSIVSLRELHPAFASEILELPAGAAAPKGFGTLAYFEKGAKRTFAVPEDLAAAMNLADANEVRLVGSTILGFTRNMLQKMATGANLAFSIPNVARDISDARKLSTAFRPYNPMDLASFAGEWAKALRERMVADPSYRQFLDARAGYSTLQKNIDPAQFLRPGSGANPLNAIADINSVLEETTKLTTFKRLKAAGKGDVEAAIETRRYGGSPDFARKGTMSPEMNLLVMFFNANVQGVARTLTRLNPAKHPARVATLLGGATMSALALDRWNRQFVDGEGVPELERISRSDREKNFIFIKPETYRTQEGATRHEYFKLPKGHVARLIFTPIEAALHPPEGGASQVALDTVENLSPINLDLKKGELLPSVGRGAVSSLNPALKAPLEQVMGAGGFDTFRNAPIVPRRLQEVEPNEQFTATTSPTIVKGTQAINRATGSRLSPMRTESFLRTGPLVGPGEALLSIIDDLVEPKAQAALAGDEATAKAPILGPILRRFVGSSTDQIEQDTLDEFYTLLERATEAKRTLAELSKRAPKEAEAHLRDPGKRALVGAEAPLRKLSANLAKLRAAQRVTKEPKALEQIALAERKLVAQVREVLKALAPEGEKTSSSGLSGAGLDALYAKYLEGAR